MEHFAKFGFNQNHHLGIVGIEWNIIGIDLQRVSLGALIISMGMMVDNAIVVVDGFVVKLKQGIDRKQAAIEAAGGKVE